eukprot:TRINITY_DN1795_c0_g2_i1.p1 TRINITY_DN1795_c0_g2~~TRINITY_DN1795_c0_g2_i1.p1  ORF type:complete len:719 (+),score=140.34 TRINITY_DN1795_c0_g2_i1:179-2158(+)
MYTEIAALREHGLDSRQALLYLAVARWGSVANASSAFYDERPCDPAKLRTCSACMTICDGTFSLASPELGYDPGARSIADFPAVLTDFGAVVAARKPPPSVPAPTPTPAPAPAPAPAKPPLAPAGSRSAPLDIDEDDDDFAELSPSTPFTSGTTGMPNISSTYEHSWLAAERNSALSARLPGLVNITIDSMSSSAFIQLDISRMVPFFASWEQLGLNRLRTLDISMQFDDKQLNGVDQRPPSFMFSQLDPPGSAYFPKYLSMFVQRFGDLLLVPLAAQRVGSRESYFVKVANAFSRFLSISTEHCVICLSPHAADAWALCACAKPACVFQVEEVGLGYGMLPILHANPLWVEMELVFALAAVNSGSHTIFEPFPSFLLIEQESHRGRSGFFETKAEARADNKRLPWIKNFLSMIPTVAQLSQQPTEEHLAISLNNGMAEKYADHAEICRSDSSAFHWPFRLLRFIITSDHNVVRPVPQGHRISEFGDNSMQFIILSNGPEMEHAFGELRRKQGFGSFFAFHGTSFENIYSILRNGLRSLSSTRLQRNGAAYGAGVYFSNSAQYALGYSRQSFSTAVPFRTKTTSLQGFFVIEIIADKKDASGGYGTSSPQICVVPDPARVALRYVIILEGQSISDTGGLGEKIAKQWHETMLSFKHATV